MKLTLPDGSIVMRTDFLTVANSENGPMTETAAVVDLCYDQPDDPRRPVGDLSLVVITDRSSDGPERRHDLSMTGKQTVIRDVAALMYDHQDTVQRVELEYGDTNLYPPGQHPVLLWRNVNG